MITRENNKKKNVDSSTRVALIRKGNQLFTDGKIELAERIFVTTDYRDGMIRAGDWYMEHGNLYKAAEMYFLSGNAAKIESFSERAALVIQKLLQDDNKEYDKIIIEK
jgi:hypothetical protein